MCKWERLFSSRSASWRQTRQLTAAAEESETSSECVVRNSGLCTRRCWFACLDGGALKMYEEVLFFSSFCWWVFFFFPERIERGIKSSRLIFYHTMVSSTGAFNIMYHSDSLFSMLTRAESHLCCWVTVTTHPSLTVTGNEKRSISSFLPLSVFTVCDENDTPTQVLAPPSETDTCSTPVQQS